MKRKKQEAICIKTLTLLSRQWLPLLSPNPQPNVNAAGYGTTLPGVRSHTIQLFGHWGSLGMVLFRSGMTWSLSNERIAQRCRIPFPWAAGTAIQWLQLLLYWSGMGAQPAPVWIFTTPKLPPVLFPICRLLNQILNGSHAKSDLLNQHI